MNSRKWQIEKHGFYALYHTTERPNPLSMAQCAEEMTKEFLMQFDKSKVSRIVSQTKEGLAENEELRKQWEAFKIEQGTPRGYLFKRELDAKNQIIWTSPYEEGQRYLIEKKAKKSFDGMVTGLNRIYEEIGKIPPKKWTYELVKGYLDNIALNESKDEAFQKCVLIRNFLPRKFGTGGETPIKTDQYKRSINERVKTYDLFTDEVEAVITYIERQGFWYVAGLHRIHMLLGCREGTITHERDMARNENGKGGILGLLWKNIDWNNQTIDVFEGKVKGGILWKGCPLDLFEWEVMEYLERLKTFKGSFVLPNIPFTKPNRSNPKEPIVYYKDVEVEIEPSEQVVFNISYDKLNSIYRYINSIYEKLWGRQAGAANYRKFDKITPHTARHLHCNLLFERGVDSTVICGDAARGEGFVGVGWTDETTMKTYYLSLVRRTVQKWIDQAKKGKGKFRPFASSPSSASKRVGKKLQQESEEDEEQEQEQQEDTTTADDLEESGG